MPEECRQQRQIDDLQVEENSESAAGKRDDDAVTEDDEELYELHHGNARFDVTENLLELLVLERAQKVVEVHNTVDERVDERDVDARRF